MRPAGTVTFLLTEIDGSAQLWEATAGLVPDIDLRDLGEHRVHDLSGVEHLCQVGADGHATESPP